MDFDKRKEKRIPNERQLVVMLKQRIIKAGLKVLEHNRLDGGFDIIYESHPGITVGIEVKSETYLSYIHTAIGQCVYRLGRGDANEAVIYTNFKIQNMELIQSYIDKLNLLIRLESIENVDGKPYYISDKEVMNWIKIG